MEAIKEDYLVEAEEAEAFCDTFVKGVQATAKKRAHGDTDTYIDIKTGLVEDFTSFLKEAENAGKEAQELLVEALRSNLPFLIEDTIDVDLFIQKVRFEWYSQVGFPSPEGGPVNGKYLQG